MSPEMGYTESVFYTKRRNDTTFFDGLSTKKTKTNSCPILVRMFKNSLDASIQYYGYQSPQKPLTYEDSESGFIGNFVNKQQNC
jgi:hypothetical protein